MQSGYTKNLRAFMRKNSIVASLVFFAVFGTGIHLFAAPPVEPYQPSETLDPTCTPGSANCTVQILPSQTGNTNKLMYTTGTQTAWAGNLFWDNTNSRLGIGTNTPVEALDVVGNISLSGDILPTVDNTQNIGSALNRFGAIYASNIVATSFSGTFTPAGFTQGSIVFSGTGGTFDQDNTNFFWDNTNNRLGLGTATPSVNLDIVSAASSDSAIVINTTSADFDSYLSLQEAGVEKWKFRNQGDSNDKLRIGSATNPLAISVSQMGQVSLGSVTASAWLYLPASNGSGQTAPLKFTAGTNITSPETGAVEYNGTQLFFTPASTRNILAQVSGSTALTTGSIPFATTSGYLAQDNSNFFWDDTNNRLGIGTATPAVALDVNGAINVRGGVTEGVNIYRSGTTLMGTLGNHDTMLTLSAAIGRDIQLNEGSTRRLVVKATTGNVGIGTTTPANNLDVAGSQTLAVDGLFGFVGAGNALSTSNYALSGNSSQTVLNTQTGGKIGFRINNSEIANFKSTGLDLSLVAGLNSSIKFGNAGVITFASTIDYTNYALYGDTTATILNAPTSTNINFRIGNSEKMRIDNAGNVGIGDTTPQGKLVVAGTGASIYQYISNTTTTGTTGIILNQTLSGGDTPGYLIRYNTAHATTALRNITELGSTGGLRFTTGASLDKVSVIDSAGNLGIGTTTPSAKLDVSTTAIIGSAAGVGSLTVGNTLGNYGSVFKMLGYSSVYKNWQIDNGITNGGTFNISPSTTNGGTTFTTPALSINTNSNVGIGTSTPGYKLDVNGVARIGDQSTSGQLYVKGFPGSGQYIYLDDGAQLWTMLGGTNYSISEDGVSRFTIKEGGNVGIGSATPSAKLHILGTTEQFRLGYDTSNYWTNTVGSTGGLTMQGVGTGGSLTLSPTAGQNLNVSLSGTGDFAVNTNQLYVDTSAGNVGVGTASPSFSLDVNGTGRFVGNLRFDAGIRDNRDNTIIAQSISSVASNRDLTIGNATYSNILFPNGNVGIGTTSPLSPLHIVGTASNVVDITGPSSSLIRFRGASNAIKGQIGFTTDGLDGLAFIDSSGSVVNLLVTDAGNVGIGTTSPSYLLDVNKSVASDLIARISNTSTSGYGLLLRGGASDGTTYALSIQNAVGTDLVRVTGAGNMGIGTSSPNQTASGKTLTIANSSPSYDANIELWANSDSVGDGASLGRIRWLAGTSVKQLASIGAVVSGTSEDTASLTFATLNGGTNTEKMRITSTGNVGIGTASPGAQLQVNASSAATIGSVFKGATSQTADLTQWQNSLGTVLSAVDSNGYFRAGGTLGQNTLKMYSDRASILVKGSTDGGTGPFIDYDINSSSTPGVTFARISNGTLSGATSGTNIAVAISPTYNPAAGSGIFRTLDINYTTNASGAQSGSITGLRVNRNVQGGSTTFTTDRIVDFQSAGTSLFTLLADGNVGIGTNTPSAKLNIVGNIIGQSSIVDATAKEFNIGVAHNLNSEEPLALITGISNGSQGIVYIGSGSSSNAATDIRFFTSATNTTLSGTERMRIDGSGNVGIGTTSPGELLHVYKNASGSNYLRIENATSGALSDAVGVHFKSASENSYINYNGFDDSMRFYVDGGGTPLATFLADGTNNGTGSVGIGTITPGRKLDILDTSSPQLRLTYTNNSVYTDIQTGIAGDLSINPTGTRVTIGSTTVPKRLEINSHFKIYQTGLDASVENVPNQDSHFIGAVTSTNSPHWTLNLGQKPGTGHIHANGTGGNVRVVGNALMPSGSSGNFYSLELGEIVNTDATATGVSSSLRINPTLTQIPTGGYRAIEIVPNNASAYGIYQSGANTKNYFNGNVGIGTTVPLANLHVVGAAGSTATFEGDSSQATLNLKTGSNSNFIVATTNNLSFRPAGTEALYLKGSNSYVGIGTATPTRKLNVVGDAVRIAGTTTADSATLELVAQNASPNRAIIKFLTPNGSTGGVINYRAFDSGNNSGLYEFVATPTGTETNAYYRFMASDDSTKGITLGVQNVASAGTASMLIGSSHSSFSTTVGGNIITTLTTNGLGIGTADTVNTGSKLMIAGGLFQIANSVGTNSVALNKGITMGSAVSDSSSFINVGSGSGWKMHFTTGGANAYDSSKVRMTIMDAGVRIGDNGVPLSSLSVKGAVGAYPIALFDAPSTSATQTNSSIQLSSTDTTVNHGIEFYNGSNYDASITQNPGSGLLKFDAGRSVAWGGNMKFFTDTVERMSIGSTGAVVINAPTSGTPLTVGGNVVFGAASTTTARINMSSTTRNQIIAADGASLEFWDGATENARIDANGNFGLGTTVPDGKLEVAGTVTGATYGFGLKNTVSVVGATQNTYGLYNLPTLTNSVTSKQSIALSSGGIVVAGTGITVDNAYSIFADTLSKTGTGTITNTYGLYVNTSTSGTNNYAAAFMNGNVGIGTASPTNKLHLYGAGGSSGLIKMESTTASGNSVLSYNALTAANANQLSGTWDFYTATATTPDFFGKIGFKFEGGTNNASRQFQVHVGDTVTPKMVVNGSGNVGIGTISPDGPLHVMSGTTSKLTLTTSDYVFATTGSRTRFGFGASTGNTYSTIQATSGGGGSVNNLVLQPDGGNIGIGTTSPNSTSRLEVYDGTAGNGLRVTRSSVTSQFIDLIPNNGTESTLISMGGNAKPAVISNRASLPIHFSTGGDGIANARMTIDGSGNVGVGTTSPSAKFHSYITTSGTSGFFESVGSSSVVQVKAVYNNIFRAGTDADNSEFSYDGGFATTYIDNNYPGVGSGGNQYGDIRFRRKLDGSTLSTVMTIRGNNGNVGIGTTSPATRFSVLGTGASTPNPATWITAGTPIVSYFSEGTTGNADMLMAHSSDTNTSRPVVIGRKSRGTLALPTALANGDTIFSFLASGYSGTSFVNTASINTQVDGTVTVTDVPQAITFETGVSSRTERMRITSSGNVGIGTSSPSGLLDVGTAARFYSTGVVNISNKLTVGVGLGAGIGTYAGQIHATDSTTIGLMVRGAVSQTADLQQWQNSAGTVLAEIDASGSMINDSLFSLTHNATSRTAVEITKSNDDGILNIYRDGSIDTKIQGNGNSYFSSLSGAFVGFGTASPLYPIDVAGSTSGTFAQRITRNTAITNSFASTNILVSKSTGDAADGFGGGSVYAISDNTAGDTLLASVGAVRNGADNSGALVFNTYLTGSFNERMRITSTGQVSIGVNTGIAQLGIVNPNAGGVAMVVRGAASQSANLVQFQDAIGTVLSRVGADGSMFIKEDYTSGTAVLMTFAGNRASYGIDSNSDFYIDTSSTRGTAIKSGAVTSLYTSSNATGNNLTVGGNTVLGKFGVINSTASTVASVVRGAASQTADLQQWQNSAGTVVADVDANGVGYFGSSMSTSGFYYGMNVGQSGSLVITNNTGSTNGNAVGAFNSTVTLAGSNVFLNGRGVNLIQNVTNTNTGNTSRAGYFSGRTSSAGAASIITGVTGGFNIEGSGAVTNAIAVEAEMYSQVNSKTITNAYGLKVQDLINSAGTITNTYGVYVGDITNGTQTTTPFSIYSSDANSYNYFAGNVGIGTAVPGYKVDIRQSTDSVGLAVRGFDDVAASGVSISVDHLGQTQINGLNSSPFVFNASNIYNVSAGAHYFAAGGGNYKYSMGGSRFAPHDASNNLDLGSSSMKWKDIYIGTNAYVDGKIALGTSSVAGKFNVGSLSADNLIYASTYSATPGHTNYWFSRKSASTVDGGASQTANGDYLGAFYFQGVNNVNAFEYGAKIYARQNGAAGAYIPTDINFSTYSSTAQNLNQFVISNTGNVGIGIEAPDSQLEIYKSSVNAHANLLKLTMNSWASSQDKHKNIVWDDNANVMGSIGLSYDAVKANMDFHSFYNGGYKTDTDILMRLTGDGRLGIGTIAPGYNLEVGSASVSGVVARFVNSSGSCDINPTTTSLSCSSDQTLKKNITSLSDEFLTKVISLRPVTYNWNAEVDGTTGHIGFIAQEVEQIFPDLVATDSVTGLKSVNYIGFIPYITKAVIEQNVKIGLIEDRVTNLENIINGTPGLIGGAISSVTNLVVDTLKVGTPEKRTGITIYDEATGDPFCIKVVNGNMQTVPGECGVVSAPVVSETPTTSPEEVVSQEPESTLPPQEETPVVEDPQNTNPSEEVTP
jgi:hypothetical protein